MLNILTITGPIYLCIGLGYAATRRGMFSKLDGQVLGRFVLNFALPAMLFNTLSQRNFPEIMNPRYLLAYGLGSLFVLAVGFAVWRMWRNKPLTETGMAVMGVSCSNSGYIGYPILLQLLGPAAGLGLALTVLVENLVTIPLALAIAESGETRHLPWHHTVWQSVQRMVKLPMMQAILLGFAFSILGWHLPEVLSRTVNLFAASTAAIALFVNGGSLVGMRVMGLIQEVRWIAVGKLVLHPLAVGLMLMLVGPIEPSLKISAVLLAGMPMLGIYPLLAQRHGQEGFCAAALLVTTLASFFTINLILWAMGELPGWHV